MSAFWSRARHVTSSCRCTLCNSSRATTVPRRVNLNTAPAPRQQGLSDAVTLFYGTVMAAALYTDASIKIGRKNRLDENITEAKDEVKALEESNRERLEALGLGSRGLLDLECEKSSTTQRSLGRNHEESRSAPKLSTKRLHWLENKLKQLEQDAARAESSAAKAQYYSMMSKIETALKYQHARLAGGEEWQSMKQNSRRFREEEKRLKENKERKKRLKSQGIANDNVERSDDLRSQLRLHLLSPMMAGVSDSNVEKYPPGRSAKDLWQDRTRQPATPYYSKRQEMAVSVLIYQLLDCAVSIHGADQIQEELAKSNALKSVQFNDSLSELIEESSTELKLIYRMKSLDNDKITNMQVNPLVRFNRHQEPSSRLRSYGEDKNRLVEAFQSQDSDTSLLVRICDILASFDQPLDIHTFNILLINFNKLQYASAAEKVWESILHCGLTCNEITIAEIFKTFSSSGSDVKFDQLYRDIDALDGAGICTLNEATAELASTYPQLVTEIGWREKTHMDAFGEFETKPRTYVRVPRNEEIYDVLIPRLLQRGDFERAGEELHRMLRAGIRPSVDIVNSLLIQALDVKDRILGETVGKWVIEGAVRGEKSSLQGTIYLLAQVACLPNAAEYTDFADKTWERINAFALKQGLVSLALKRSDFEQLKAREIKKVASRLIHACRLDEPSMHLRFDVHRTWDLSEEVTCRNELQLGGRQPINLLEYTAVNLLHAYKQFVQRNGPIDEQDAANKEIILNVDSASKWLAYKEGAIDFLSNRPKKRGGNAKHAYLQATKAKMEGNQQALPTASHAHEDTHDAHMSRQERAPVPLSSTDSSRSAPLKPRGPVSSSTESEHDRFNGHFGPQRWIVEGVQQNSAGA